MKKLLAFFAIILLIYAGIFAFATACTPKEEEDYVHEGDVTLFVANDLGRNGYYQQKTIAELMGEMAEKHSPEAILALGDIHHFDGVASISDPLWLTNYERVYSHPELMIEWCPILGNHEYRGCTQAVVNYTSVSRRWMMPSRYYERTFADNGVSVKVVLIDTTPLIDKYRTDTTTYPDTYKQDVARQLQWLDSVLSVSNSDWTIVAGHHPIYADTQKNTTERTDLQQRVEPLLREHRVDIYLSGHIHNFQHIRPQDSSVDYVVNSSASLSREKVKAVDGTLFCSGDAGFSIITANKDELNLHMIDSDGKIIHTVSRYRAVP